MDTSFNYCDPKKGYFSSDEKKWISYILKLEEQYPDQVHVTVRPENNDGCICARLPVGWFKIKPKKSKKMTDEEKLAFKEKMALAREKKQALE